jgi:hypothetical protein
MAWGRLTGRNDDQTPTAFRPPQGYQGCSGGRKRSKQERSPSGPGRRGVGCVLPEERQALRGIKQPRLTPIQKRHLIFQLCHCTRQADPVEDLLLASRLHLLQ